MFHEIFHEINVFGQRKRSKGNHSAAICAYWPGTDGTVSPSCDELRVGVVQHFINSLGPKLIYYAGFCV